jgi:hypothetical protein
VKAALAAALAERTRTLMVECRFLTIDADRHRDIDAELVTLLDRAAVDRAGHVVLSERQAAVLLREAQGGTAKQVSSPRVTLFENQHAYVLVARQISYVAGFTRGRDEKGGARFEPVVEVAQSGIMLEVRASSTPDRSAVALDLHPRSYVLRGMAEQPWKDAPADQKLMVQVPDLRTFKADRLITLPTAHTALIRLHPDKDDAAPGSAVYVLVTGYAVDPDGDIRR